METELLMSCCFALFVTLCVYVLGPSRRESEIWGMASDILDVNSTTLRRIAFSLSWIFLMAVIALAAAGVR